MYYEDDEIPKELFHYCSANGLHGIVCSKSIWATEIHCLNDAQEFRYTYSLIRDVIKRILTNADLMEREKKFFQSLPNLLNSTEWANVFIVSFSAVGDLLSQWRAYCPNGSGYSVGFDSKKLIFLAEKQNFTLEQCIYDREVQESQAYKLLMHGSHEYYDKSEKEDDVEILKTTFLPYLKHIAAIMKHPSFEEECEWRLVSRDLTLENSYVNYRPVNNNLIPYIPFKLEYDKTLNSIGSIRIGPTPDIELTEHSLKAFITSNKLTNQIKKSSIPFRGWT